MTNPRTLFLSIAATACGLALTLVGASGLAPTTSEADLTATANLTLAQAHGADRRKPDPFAAAGELTPDDHDWTISAAATCDRVRASW